MPKTIYPIEPPAGGMDCRNCGDPIVATAKVFGGGLTINGLREYRWTHSHGSEQCKPKTVAQPYDGWHATAKVEAVLAARRAHEEALELALSDPPFGSAL